MFSAQMLSCKSQLEVASLPTVLCGGGLAAALHNAQAATSAKIASQRRKHDVAERVW